MNRRTLLKGLAGTALAAGLPTTAHAIAPDQQAAVVAALVEALTPRRPGPPVVAIVMDASGAETTDTLVPYGVLARSGLAEVHLLAVDDVPVRLMPALTVTPTGTLAAFERDHAHGADIVVVPAFHDPRSPTIHAFLQRQHAQGALVGGICAGGIVLAEAGLLDGREAATHWYETGKVRRAADGVRLRQDRRYVVDGRIATTTGVSASIPFSLALVEAIGGRAAASALAAELGVSDWSARHDQEAFGLGAEALFTAVTGPLSPWAHETYALPVADGVDEIALALAADALSRTWRSDAIAVAPGPVRTAAGLVITPDRAAPEEGERIVEVRSDRPALALDDALARIRADFGPRVARFVALQLEYGEGA